MAHDLYGELLARALQRQAPPGHFPAFVTPGEANLLRSQGGGVAPGGGQFMAGGIPAFFEEGYGGLGEPGYGGGAMGFEDFGFMHTPAEEDEAAWEGVIAAGMLGLEGFTAVDEGDYGRSRSDQYGRFLAARMEREFAAPRRGRGPPPPAPSRAPPPAALAPAMQPVAPPAQRSAAPPAPTDTISERGTESYEEESLEQTQTPYSGDTTDQGAEQQQANLDAAFAASMNAMENPNDAAAQAAAHSTEMGLSGSISQGGMGRFSPATSWGINSEIGNATFSQLQALNAQDHQGYAINNPQPTDASILASQVFAQLNPTITNAVIGLSGFLPGTVGFVGFLAGMIENKGLLNIPAVRSIPGVQTLTDILDIPRSVAAALTEPFTEPLGRALSQGQQALAEALSEFPESEESAGFGDADEADGAVPDTEFVLPTDTEADAEPAEPARSFAEVDEATRRRILENILSGLQRTDRPTEGVTAFDPLFA